MLSFVLKVTKFLGKPKPRLNPPSRSVCVCVCVCVWEGGGAHYENVPLFRYYRTPTKTTSKSKKTWINKFVNQWSSFSSTINELKLNSDIIYISESRITKPNLSTSNTYTWLQHWTSTYRTFCKWFIDLYIYIYIYIYIDLYIFLNKNTLIYHKYFGCFQNLLQCVCGQSTWRKVYKHSRN